MRRGQRLAVLIGIVLGLLLAGLVDMTRRGVFHHPPFTALRWIGAPLGVLAILLAARWTLPPLWRGRRRGYVRARAVGALAVLAGLYPTLPHGGGLARQAYAAFWEQGPDPVSNFCITALVMLGSWATWAATYAVGHGEKVHGRRPMLVTWTAVAVYAVALLWYASPLVVRTWGPEWTVFPAWPEPPVWALIAGALGMMAMAEGAMLLRTWAMYGLICVSSLGGLTAMAALAGDTKPAAFHSVFIALTMLLLLRPEVRTAFKPPEARGDEQARPARPLESADE